MQTRIGRQAERRETARAQHAPELRDAAQLHLGVRDVLQDDVRDDQVVRVVLDPGERRPRRPARQSTLSGWALSSRARASISAETSTAVTAAARAAPAGASGAPRRSRGRGPGRPGPTVTVEEAEHAVQIASSPSRQKRSTSGPPGRPRRLSTKKNASSLGAVVPELAHVVAGGHAARGSGGKVVGRARGRGDPLRARGLQRAGHRRGRRARWYPPQRGHRRAARLRQRRADLGAGLRALRGGLPSRRCGALRAGAAGGRGGLRGRRHGAGPPGRRQGRARAARGRRAAAGRGQRRSAVGFALLAAVTLDGVPENLALGVSLVDGASLTLLVAIFFSNLPESLVGAVAMRSEGRSARVGRSRCGWPARSLLAVAVVAGRGAGRRAERRGPRRSRWASPAARCSPRWPTR